MLKQLDIGGEILVVGDKCTTTAVGAMNGFRPTNTQFTIWGFKENDETLIGLYSPLYSQEWADLNGNVKSGHGLWITPSNFLANMILINIKYKVLKFMFKNEKLDSMECKILHEYKDSTAFVEMDKNVGGGSCDGLGKTGHCIILPTNMLRKIKNVQENKHYG